MTTGPSQALNLGSPPLPYNDSFIALDLMKGLSQWQYWNGTEGIDLRPDQLFTDERGWITDLPVINGQTTGIFANVFYGKIMKPGQFIMEWQGEGEIEVNQPYTVIGPNKLLISFSPDYLDDQGNPEQDGITVILNSTDPNNTGNHIHDIKLYDIKNADLIAAGEKFDPVWFDRIDDFRVLRTHDWQSTNFPTTVNWGRNVEVADQANWGFEGRGMPYELLVEIANETRSDLWINIPHTASDQYMREAAAYVKANLDPDLKLHVEFSNEYWTTIFDQYAYFQAGGAREFGDAAFGAGQFYGTEAANMAQIFNAVFGADSTQLRPMLTVDDLMFKSGEAEAMLKAAGLVPQDSTGGAPQAFDVIATDGYLTWWAPDPSTADMIRDWMTDPDGGFGRARDFLINQLNTDVLPNWQAGKALADAYGLDFMVYEGGALLLNQVENPDPALTDFAIRFSESAEMKEVYEAELAAWATVGMGPFAWYSDVGRPGPWGDYGMWNGPEFVAEPRADAVTAANAATAPWWDGDDRPASTFDNGKYAAGTTANDVMGGTGLADRLYGLAGNDRLNGKDGADRLSGGDGNDRLIGGKGADTLTGGAGDDRFVFNTKDAAGDVLTDFAVAGNDVIALASRVFGSHTRGALPEAAFQASGSAVAGKATTRIIYDEVNNTVWFDPDGTGAQTAILLFTAQPDAVIVASDFLFF